MAKIIHSDFSNTIEEIITDARNRGIIHLRTTGETLSGRKINIEGNELINFGTCGYLALETDNRLKEGVIDFTERFGTQFSMSRTYITSGINIDLESYIEKMYGCPVIVQSSTSTCHISVIPAIVKEGDAILLDQQVHMSVQTATQLAQHKGVLVDMIRHSNLEMLERKIIELGKKYKRIWYMIDGVYSMYGDVAPIHELIALLNKYDTLYLYVDDAHGMGWYGKNGTGYAFGEVGIHEKMILITTLAKGFGVTGGIAVFPNNEFYNKVKLFGGPLTYSHPLAPPLLGAAIASAKIHLSDEIYVLQKELADRINYCNDLLEHSGLPVISNPFTPIHFIGLGQPNVGYNMIKRIFNSGFYVSIGLFPAVPVKCTGLRFTITRHVMMEDIKSLIDTIVHHFPLALKEEERTENDIRRAFRLPLKEEKTKKATSKYQVQHETTIHKIDREEWDNLLGSNGSFDSEGMHFLEDAFSNNPKKEDNWQVHYYIIREKKTGKPLLATFFTAGIYKDDMLAPESVTRQIEEKRKNDPYYLTSTTLAMGSLLTVGQHLFLDRSYSEWEDVLTLLLDEVAKEQDRLKANVVLLRDFEEDDIEMRDFLLEQGFVKMEMPKLNVITNVQWNTDEEFLSTLSKKSRMHVKTDVFRYRHMFDIEIKDKISDEEAKYFHRLYLNVKDRNFGISYFAYPEKMVKVMSHHPNWEFIILKIKSEFDPANNKLPVAVILCYKGLNNYSPMLMGLDYNYLKSHKIYKQALYQITKRARELNYNIVNLGVTADMEKKKIGAKQIPAVAYLQAKDNYNMEVMHLMQATGQD